MNDERIRLIAEEYRHGLDTLVDDFEAAIKQALAERDAEVAKAIDPTGKVFTQDMGTSFIVGYRKELANKIKQGDV